MAKKSMNDDKLISLVQARNVIYDKTDRFYTSKTHVRNAWKEIAVEMNTTGKWSSYHFFTNNGRDEIPLPGAWKFVHLVQACFRYRFQICLASVKESVSPFSI